MNLQFSVNINELTIDCLCFQTMWHEKGTETPLLKKRSNRDICPSTENAIKYFVQTV
jgi:hypothetical protein